MPRAAQTAAWTLRPGPFMLRAQREHGDAFTIRIGTEPPWVMLAHPDAVREVFTGDPKLLHAGKANIILRPFLGRASVLLLDGPQHLRQRKLMLPAFHGSRMAGYRDMVAEIAREQVAAWPRGEPLALAPRMQAITLEVVLRVIFGVRGTDRLDALRGRLRTMMERLMGGPSMLALLTAGPDRAERARLFRPILAPGRPAAAEQIRERRADPGDDVLSLLLAARDEDGSPMSDAELRDELVTLLVAGHETTATALSWAAERLVRHARRLGGAARRRRGVRRGGGQGGAAPAPGAAGRAAPPAGGHDDRRPRPAGGHGRGAVDLPRPPPPRALPRAGALPARALPRRRSRRAARTRGSRSAAACAAASARRSR